MRELEHAIHRAAVLARAEQGSQAPTLASHHFNLAAGPLPPSTSPATAPMTPFPGGLGLRAATHPLQPALLEHTLAAHDGNWAATARAPELYGGNLHRLAKRLGLKA